MDQQHGNPKIGKDPAQQYVSQGNMARKEIISENIEEWAHELTINCCVSSRDKPKVN